MTESRFIQEVRRRVIIHSAICLPTLILGTGCPACVDGVYGFTVSGTFVDGETGAPVGDNGYSLVLRRDGQEVAIAAFAPGSDAGAAVADANGDFSIQAVEGGWGGCRLIGLFPRWSFEIPEPTHPDEAVFTVSRRESCEQVVTVPINEDTVVDRTFPNDTIEFRDPIAVPPCEQP